VDVTRLLFVRHGETAWNRVLRFRGRADVPLNATGRAQARRVAARLAPLDLAAVYASPLSRTLETARLIAAPHGLAVAPEDALVDLDYGAWQGRTPAEVARSDGARLQRWRTDPARVRIPGGEPLGALRARVLRLVRRLVRRHRGATVVLVSHDIVGRTLVAALLGLPLRTVWRIGQDNAALSVFEHGPGGFAVVSVNDTGHLTPRTTRA